MSGVDQILSVVVQQGANELRLGTDQEPQVFAHGARRRFTMSPTPDSVLRQLLGEIFSAEREAELAKLPRLGFDYEAHGIGRFQVQISRRASGGMDVVFLQSAGRGAPVRAKLEPSDASVVEVNKRPGPGAAGTLVQMTPDVHPVEVTPQREYNPRFAQLIEQAVLSRASDLHLADGQPAFLRVDGRLRTLSEQPIPSVSELFGLDGTVVAKLMAGNALELGLALSPRERLRVCLYRMEAGITAAVRILPAAAPLLSELNLPLQLQHLAELPHGLVLLCGATGSGKSTTLAALSRHALEHRSVVLVTLEDPIEFALSGSGQSLVRQRQVGRDVTDFTTGLRDALRGDPDVIVVGELRDAETIRLAITAAETGHLVLASLHSGSATGCVERVIDAYPQEQRSQVRIQLAEALRAVVVQKLVPRTRGTGRVPALEVLRVTHGVANVIREGKTAQIGSMLQAGKRDGMVSLERCLAEYVQAGVISVEHAKTHANDVDSLTMYLAK
jgi:twitching motility protein PilT